MLFHLCVFLVGVLTTNSELLDKFEGEKCTWNGISGTCVRVYQCQSFFMYKKKREFPPTCTFDGKEPIICCTDCQTVEDTSKVIFNDQLGMLHLTGPKAKDECVRYIDKLDYNCKVNSSVRYVQIFDLQMNCFISSESKSTPDFTPARQEAYMALLGYGDALPNAQWLCAGAIISDKFVLTAGHCLVDSSRKLVKFIALGITRRIERLQNWQSYGIKRIIPHPEYSYASKYHDIALLETDNTIIFSSKVLPACLHTDETLENEAEIITLDGSKDQKMLQPVSLKQLDSLASIFYPPQEILKDGFNETLQLCYGDLQKPTDSCQSDSGGPLLAKSKLAGCAPIVIGVTSFDRVCGTAASSGLYTKISHYVPWIQSIVWP